MASPLWQSVGTARTDTAATTLSIPFPSGHTSGDIMIVSITVPSTTTITKDFGSTDTVIRNTTNGNLRHYVAWSPFAQTPGPDTGLVEWTYSFGASVRATGAIHRITGAHATSPVEGSGTPATGSGTTPDPPSYTPGSSQDYLFLATAGMADKNATSTPPTNYTERSDQSTAGAGPGADHSSQTLASRALTTGTAENPGVFTFGNAAWIANTIAIQPAAGGASPQTITVNEPAESEAAQAVTASPGLVTVSVDSNEASGEPENESAQPVSVQASISVAVVAVVESEAAQTVTPTQPAGSQNIAVNAASETESAEAIAFSRSLVQARPDADLDASDWETAPTPSQPLYQQIDESVTDDNDYIYADLVVLS